MQTQQCCNRPHYIEHSNGYTLYCVTCGATKPIYYYATQPIWVVPQYIPPYTNPYPSGPWCGGSSLPTNTGVVQTFGGTTEVTGFTVQHDPSVPFTNTLTDCGGSINIASSTTFMS